MLVYISGQKLLLAAKGRCAVVTRGRMRLALARAASAAGAASASVLRSRRRLCFSITDGRHGSKGGRGMHSRSCIGRDRCRGTFGLTPESEPDPSLGHLFGQKVPEATDWSGSSRAS